MIPPTNSKNDLTSLLCNLNGLLFPGGDDMDPKYFHEAPHPSLLLTDPEITKFHMDVCHLAISKNMPILGICAGHQLINVACGGSIYQDIPSQYENSIKHKKNLNEKEDAIHYIKIEKNTRLYNIFQTNKIKVNSTHHQALKNIAEGFIVTARSDDGIVEAIESTNHTFVISVQWHPEDLYKENTLFLNLFKKFIHEANGFEFVE